MVESLFRHFWPRLVGYCLRCTHDAPLAEDLAAQAFLKALEAERDGRGPYGPPEHWLLTIAKRLWIDAYHSADCRRGCGWDEAFAWTEPSDDGGIDLDALDAAGEVAWLLPFLTSDQRAVVELYDLEGYTLDEVAERIGKHYGAVQGLRHRAVLKMRSKHRTAPPG